MSEPGLHCHDCGEPAQKYRLLAIVGRERWAFCETHGTQRYKAAPEGQVYYTGPLPMPDQSKG